jgi:CO/xanthine dehydrogenase FAD-binding subunit
MTIDKWFSPQTIDDLKNVLKDKTETDAFIAGGTDLIIACKNNKIIDGLIDLTGLTALHEVIFNEKSVFIGATVTYAEIAGNPKLQKCLPALTKAASMIGSQQIRNRGTMAGGVANASPASDIIPVLCCLQAIVRIMDSKGAVSEIPIADFILGVGKTKLAIDQCIIGFVIPVSDHLYTAYVKLGSRSQVTIAQITGTIGVYVENDKISSCNLVVGSIGIKPVSLQEATSGFLGKKISDLTEGDALKCADFFVDYIKVNVAKQFDRDYKLVAVKGVFLDLFVELQQNYTNS